MLLPVARRSDILVQDLDKELLVYNLETNQVYSLNETSKHVYQNCDGQTSFAELKDKFNYSNDLIFLTLDELKKNDLLENSYQSKFANLSRRELIRRVGLTSVAALPLITAIVAPNAAMAASQAGICAGAVNECACAGGTPFGTTCGRGLDAPIWDNDVCPENCSCQVKWAGCAGQVGGYCTGDCIS